MAKLADSKSTKIKNPTRQRIIVAQSRIFGSPEIPYKILHTEIVSNLEEAKVRQKELTEEYKNIEGLSVSYFSL